MTEYVEKISLERPKISREAVLGAASGVRPFRKGGIRLEGEHIRDKYVVHNYGHGGGGFSLSYGSAYIASQIAQRQFGHIHKQCAVIGSGYLGLFTAICLRLKGYKVTVYTSRVPFEEYQGSRMASEIAPGYWMPYGYDNQDEVKHQILARLSFEYLVESIKKNRYKGIFLAHCYHLGESWPPFKKIVPSGLINDGKQVMIDFGNGVYIHAFRHTSIFANGKVFLQELLEECRLRKVDFVKRTFKDLDDVLSVSEKFVYNCSGMGSATLFGDKNMVPVKGTLVYLRDPINYYFTADTPDGTVTVYPSQGKLTLGLTREEGRSSHDVDPQQVDRLLQNAIKFFTKNSAKL